MALEIVVVSETFPPEVNGVAMTVGRLVHGLRARGHRVEVIRPRQTADDRGGNDERAVPGLPLPGYAGLRLGLPAGRRLARLWRLRRPDLVHVVTEGPLGWSAVSAARRLGIPVTSSFHTNFDRYSAHYGVGWLRPAVAA
jgi:glycosyltransferase involved in cell wall biosynthesis